MMIYGCDYVNVGHGCLKALEKHRSNLTAEENSIDFPAKGSAYELPSSAMRTCKHF